MVLTDGSDWNKYGRPSFQPQISKETQMEANTTEQREMKINRHLHGVKVNLVVRSY